MTTKWETWFDLENLSWKMCWLLEENSEVGQVEERMRLVEWWKQREEEEEEEG